MTDEEIAACVKAATDASETAHAFVPQMDSYGFFSQDEIGMFMWFESKVSLHSYLREHVAFICDPVDPDAMLASIRTAIETIQRDSLSDEAAFVLLNSILEPDQRIVWWGTFADLAEEDSEFAKDIRESFRDHTKEVLDESALQSGELDEFREFIRSYGY